jgi:cytochrome c5
VSARAVAALAAAVGLAAAWSGGAKALPYGAVGGQGVGPAAATRGLPEAPGADVARAKCIGCHEADLIVSQRLSSTGWDREVAKMERWGAKLSADERAALVGYLAGHFGVRPMASHDAAAVAAGEAVYKAACRSCHEDDLSEQQRLSAAAWGRTVDKMVRWGAKVSAEDKPALVAYLTSRWGHP